MDQNKLDLLKHFIRYCKKELNIQSLPKISMVNDKSFVEERRSFGEYSPGLMSIKVFYPGRNLADVCRSLAHELTHHRQNELGIIYDAAGETGTDIENDANAMAGIIMREYGRLNNSVYELQNLKKDSLKEVGRIENPYPSKYAFADDDGNVFYSFDTPEHTYSVAFTLHDEDRYELFFNTAGDMGQDTGENVAMRVLSTVGHITNEFIEKYKPEEVVFRPIKTKGEGDERRFRVYKIYLEKNIPSDYKLFTVGNTFHLMKK